MKSIAIIGLLLWAAVAIGQTATPTETPTQTETPETPTETPGVPQLNLAVSTPTFGPNDCCEIILLGFPVCVAPPPHPTPGNYTCSGTLVYGGVCNEAHHCTMATMTPTSIGTETETPTQTETPTSTETVTQTPTPTGDTPTPTATEGVPQDNPAPTSTIIGGFTPTRTFTPPLPTWTPTPTRVPSPSGYTCCQGSVFGVPFCLAPPPTTTPGVYDCSSVPGGTPVPASVCDAVTYQCVTPTPVQTPLHCVIIGGTHTATPAPTQTPRPYRDLPMVF